MPCDRIVDLFGNACKARQMLERMPEGMEHQPLVSRNAALLTHVLVDEPLAPRVRDLAFRVTPDLIEDPIPTTSSLHECDETQL